LNPLQEHEGDLNFATEAWTSPNLKAYVAVSVHFEINGVLVGMLLDVVKVACLHTGFNLAVAFAMILQDFGISHKVGVNNCEVVVPVVETHRFPRSSATLATTPQIMTP
jgi:hypothetical protein